MIRRLRARLALLRVWWEGVERDMNNDFDRRLTDAGRALAWVWNSFKALAVVQQVGHGIATVLGLYRLDRWLTRREAIADLRLANKLTAAGLADQAEALRTAAVERITRK